MPRFSARVLTLLALAVAPAGTPAAAAGSDPAAWTTAQPAASLPTPESLFERHIEAVGGLAALKRHHTRVANGRMEMVTQGVRGFVTLEAQAPDKLRVTMEFPGVANIETVYDGSIAWTRIADMPPRLLEGDDLISFKESADFLGEASYKSRYKSLETVGKESFNGTECYKVRAITTLADRETFLFFDVATGRELGIRTRRLVNGKDEDIEIQLLEYKEYDGVQIPAKTVQKTSQGEMVLTFDTIEVNPKRKLNFDPPEEVRKLAEEAGVK